MSSLRRAPPVLETFLRLPSEMMTLTLLTSTLGCTTNWLAAHFIGNALSRPKGMNLSAGEIKTTDLEDSSNVVVMVSWMRDLTFWKLEVRRGTGIDVSKAMQQGHFAFVDLLAQDALPSKLISEAECIIVATINQIKQQRPGCSILLVLDSPDVLLATAAATARDLNRLVLSLRSLVQATLLTLSADYPMISAALSSRELLPLPIESETAAFALGQAHCSRLIMSARELESGAAKDISGVLLITRGGDAWNCEDNASESPKDSEKLYLIQRDGSAKVFDRGTEPA